MTSWIFKTFCLVAGEIATAKNHPRTHSATHLNINRSKRCGFPFFKAKVRLCRVVTLRRDLKKFRYYKNGKGGEDIINNAESRKVRGREGSLGNFKGGGENRNSVGLLPRKMQQFGMSFFKLQIYD